MATTETTIAHLSIRCGGHEPMSLDRAIEIGERIVTGRHRPWLETLRAMDNADLYAAIAALVEGAKHGQTNS